MAQGILPIDLSVQNLSCSSFKPPAGCITDNSVASGAAIAAAKLIHMVSKIYQQNQTAAVVADSQYCHIVQGSSCTVAGLNASVDTVATGADRTVSVDLQRSTGGGSFASILTTPLVFNNSSVARTVTHAALSVTTLLQYDILKWVITVAGVAGNQAIGLVSDAVLYEAAS